MNVSPWHLTSESHEHHGPVTEMRVYNTCNLITLSFYRVELKEVLSRNTDFDEQIDRSAAVETPRS